MLESRDVRDMLIGDGCLAESDEPNSTVAVLLQVGGKAFLGHQWPAADQQEFPQTLLPTQLSVWKAKRRQVEACSVQRITETGTDRDSTSSVGHDPVLGTFHSGSKQFAEPNRRFGFYRKTLNRMYSQ